MQERRTLYGLKTDVPRSIPSILLISPIINQLTCYFSSSPFQTAQIQDAKAAGTTGPASSGFPRVFFRLCASPARRGRAGTAEHPLPAPHPGPQLHTGCHRVTDQNTTLLCGKCSVQSPVPFWCCKNMKQASPRSRSDL